MIIYAYKAWFKTSNLKLTTSHFVSQTLLVWKRASNQQKILTILTFTILGISLPIFGFSLLITLLIFLIRNKALYKLNKILNKLLTNSPSAYFK